MTNAILNAKLRCEEALESMKKSIAHIDPEKVNASDVEELSALAWRVSKIYAELNEAMIVKIAGEGR